METNETPVVKIVKGRSYVASLREGIKYPFLHFGEMCRFLWPVTLFLVILSIGVTLTELHLILGYNRLPELSVSRGLALVLLEFLSLSGTSLFMGHVLYQQQQLTLQGVLPNVKPCRACGKLWKPALRFLFCGFIVKLLFNGVLALFALALLRSWFLLLLPVALLLLCLLFLVPSFLEYLFTEASFLAAFKAGKWRYMGNTTIVLLLSLFAASLVSAIGALPLFSVIGIDALVFQASLQGDVILLPTFFPCLRVVCIVLYTLVNTFALLLFFYPLLFHWGSTIAFEQERRANDIAATSSH